MLRWIQKFQRLPSGGLFAFQPQPTDDTHGTPSYRQRLRLVADPFLQTAQPDSREVES
nr:MAG TPA: hypothetical protein [Caudoviricetes sp.]